MVPKHPTDKSHDPKYTGVQTFEIAFLYLAHAFSCNSLMVRSPEPHGTTTRISPKQTVTFIFVSLKNSTIKVMYQMMNTLVLQKNT